MLRRILTTVSLLAGLAGNAQQERFFGHPQEDNKRFYGGLSFGAAFTQVDGDNYAGYNKVGLHFGPTVYAMLTDNVALSLELNFIQKGSKVRKVLESPYLSTYVASYDIKLNYLEIPFELNYIDNHRLHYSAGLSYARLISSKEELFDIYQQNLDSSIYSFKPQDFNWNVGVGYQLYKHLFLTGRFSYSLVSIRDFDHVPYGQGTGDQRNNLFTFRLLYLF